MGGEDFGRSRQTSLRHYRNAPRRGEAAGEAREIPTLFKYAAAAPAVGSRSFSFKHQREFAQNATRLPSFFGRVSPLAPCDAE